MDLVAFARSILDTNLYVTLATADGDGRPWASPVYFATADYTDFYWTSSADAEHSRNIAVRPDIGLVIFDSAVEPYSGQAVYLTATARALDGDELRRGVEIYSAAARRGAGNLDLADVTPPAEYRLYRATATGQWLSCPRERGEPCSLHGRTVDHRAELASLRPSG